MTNLRETGGTRISRIAPELFTAGALLTFRYSDGIVVSYLLLDSPHPENYDGTEKLTRYCCSLFIISEKRVSMWYGPYENSRLKAAERFFSTFDREELADEMVWTIIPVCST